MNRIFPLLLLTLSTAFGVPTDVQIRASVVYPYNSPRPDCDFVEDSKIGLCGFVHREPDFVVTELTSISAHKEESENIYFLYVGLTQQSSAQFAELTAKTVGNKLLFKLGDETIALAHINQRIETQKLPIQVRATGAEIRRILKKIGALVSKELPNKPLHGTPAKAPSSSTESEGRRP